MFSKVLVPTDFSDDADAALDLAREIAAKFGGSLCLLHVMKDPALTIATSMEGYVPDLTAVREAMHQDAVQRLEARVSARDTTMLHATADVFFGVPGHDVCEYARQHGFDLIVMGTHGRTGLRHLVMGSVAEEVIRTAPCAVTVVRRRAAATAKAA